MKHIGKILFVSMFLLLTASCGQGPKSQNVITTAPYFSPFVGYYNDELLTVMDYRLVTLDKERGVFSYRCQKEGCDHNYNQRGENTCQAALPIATAMGFYNEKIYLVHTPQDMYHCTISEFDPDTGEQKEINVFRDLVNIHWGVFYKDYYYYISDNIMQMEVPQLKLKLKRIAIKPGALPETLWEMGDEKGFPQCMQYQLCDNLLIFTVRVSTGDMLNAYDLDTGELIIDASDRLDGAYYHEGKLYYNESYVFAEPDNRPEPECKSYRPQTICHSVEIYDLETRDVTGSIPLLCEGTADLALAGDELYLYISQTAQDPVDFHEYSNIYVYDYDGNYINTIVIDEKSGYNNVTYLFSTESHVFIGSWFHFWPQTKLIYAVDKIHLQNEDVPRVIVAFQGD